ncbi:MAG: DUF421 domain-containing protein [Clostridia bacterium]
MQNLNEYLYLIVMSLTSVAVLFVISKLLGKKQIAQLEFIDYVMGISIGSIAAEMATDTGDKPIEFYIIAMVLFFLFDIAVSFFGRKSAKLKHFFKGRPITIIYDGEIDYKALKSSKLDVNDVIGLCREQGYFDLSDIAFAVFENSGNLSVMPVGSKAPLTIPNLNDMCQNLNAVSPKNTENTNITLSRNCANIDVNSQKNSENVNANFKENSENLIATPKENSENAVQSGKSESFIPVEKASLPFYMVVDGTISFSSLTELKQDKDWLFEQLNITSAKQLKNIILAVYNDKTKQMKVTCKNN